MGANEARHVLAMTDDLGKVLALELYTAAQALDLRRAMIAAARELATHGDARTLAAKIQCGPMATDGQDPFLADVERLRKALAGTSTQPGKAVAAAHAVIRKAIPFLDRDRALDGEVAAALRLVADGSVLAAARTVLSGDPGQAKR